MTKFTTGDQASTAALAAIDAQLQTIDTNANYSLWREWIKDRAIAQQALAASADGNPVLILAGFKATANGNGYSIGDLIFLRQSGANPAEYYNGTTGLVINPAPPSDNLGAISSSSNVNVTSSTLPTGASTSTLQSDGNTLLTSLNTKTPALGQALATASTPVVLPASQITALTPPTSVGITGTVAVTGTFYQSTQPVSIAVLPSLAAGSNAIGSITNTAFIANAGTNLNTSALALESGGNLASIKANTDNLGLTQGSTTSGQKGALILGATTTSAPSYTTGQTNPLSLAVNGDLRVVANQSGTWNITNTNLSSIDGKLPPTLGVKPQTSSLSAGVAQDQNAWAQLSAPGSTSSFTMIGYKRATIAAVVGAINSSVTLRAEGTLDSTNWFNLNSTDTDKTITANGCYAFNVEAALAGIRLTFVSESGGTSATIDATVRVSA